MKNEISLEDFKKILSKYLGVHEKELTKDTSFMKDLRIDSLSMVNFIIKMEKEFEVKFDLNYVWELSTVGKAYEHFVNVFKTYDSDVK